MLAKLSTVWYIKINDMLPMGSLHQTFYIEDITTPSPPLLIPGPLPLMEYTRTSPQVVWGTRVKVRLRLRLMRNRMYLLTVEAKTTSGRQVHIDTRNTVTTRTYEEISNETKMIN